MELKEQITKAIIELRTHGLSYGGTIGYHAGWCDDVADRLANALALINSQEQRIKELTQAHEMLSESYDHLEKTKDELLAERSRLTKELQKLKKVKYIFSTVDYCADDLAKALEENKRLSEENERLRAIPEQMKERLQAYFGTYVLGYAVNQIAKELLEGE